MIIDLSDERRANKPWLPDDDHDVTNGLVTEDAYGKPACARHGAMNLVDPHRPVWRCSEFRCGVGAEIVEDAPGFTRCRVHLIHKNGLEARCIRHADHGRADTNHIDGHGCQAKPLVSMATIEEVARVAREWPDGIHTCAELQRLEPGRRPCTCGRCPSRDAMTDYRLGVNLAADEKDYVDDYWRRKGVTMTEAVRSREVQFIV